MVSNVGILDNLIILTIVGRIVDADGIQVEVVRTLLLMVKGFIVIDRDHGGVPVVGQSLNLHDRNLIQRVLSIPVHDPAILHAGDFIAVLGAFGLLRGRFHGSFICLRHRDPYPVALRM